MAAGASRARRLSCRLPLAVFEGAAVLLEVTPLALPVLLGADSRISPSSLVARGIFLLPGAARYFHHGRLLPAVAQVVAAAHLHLDRTEAADATARHRRRERRRTAKDRGGVRGEGGGRVCLPAHSGGRKLRLELHMSAVEEVHV